MIEDTTPQLHIQLPSVENTLDIDVHRLRSALGAIDGFITNLQTESAKETSLQELSDALALAKSSLQAADNVLTQAVGTKVNQTEFDAWQSNFSTWLGSLQTTTTNLQNQKVSSVNGMTGQAIMLTGPDLLLGPANGAGLTTIAYDGSGKVTSVTENIQGYDATSTYSYDGLGRVFKVVITYKGRTRTETINYDSAGRVSSITAVEV